MRKYTKWLLGLFLLIGSSCKKEYSCERCNLKPPDAEAGTDRTIQVPVNSVVDPYAKNITIGNLSEGIAEFELTVTDSWGQFSKDTSHVKVVVRP